MNVDLHTRPDDLVATRHGADVDRPERADENEYHAAGRFYASAADAAFWKNVEREKAERTERRRAQYVARQRTAQDQQQQEAAPEAAPAPAELPEGVEPTRRAAAAQLVACSVGPSQYRVTGGREPHFVDLAAEGAALPQCDCADSLYRPTTICKHVLAALAAEGDSEIRAALESITSAERSAA